MMKLLFQAILNLKAIAKIAKARARGNLYLATGLQLTLIFLEVACIRVPLE